MNNKPHDGKGSTPRPYSVSMQAFSEKFDVIFGKKSKRDTKPCAYCTGRGFVVFGNASHAYQDECPKCDGDGQVSI